MSPVYPPNRFAGTCVRCGFPVEPNTGVLFPKLDASVGGWQVRHAETKLNGRVTCSMARANAGAPAKRVRGSPSPVAGRVQPIVPQPIPPGATEFDPGDGHGPFTWNGRCWERFLDFRKKDGE